MTESHGVSERHYRGYLLKELEGDMGRIEIWYRGRYITDATNFSAATKIIDDYHNAR